MIRISFAFLNFSLSFPHARGDDPRHVMTEDEAKDFSPRPWG